jgi:hypothetical protein
LEDYPSTSPISSNIKNPNRAVLGGVYFYLILGDKKVQNFTKKFFTFLVTYSILLEDKFTKEVTKMEMIKTPSRTIKVGNIVRIHSSMEYAGITEGVIKIVKIVGKKREGHGKRSSIGCLGG